MNVHNSVKIATDGGTHIRRSITILAGAFIAFTLILMGAFGVAQWKVQSACRDARNTAAAASEQIVQWVKQSQGDLFVQQVRSFLADRASPGEIVDEPGLMGLSQSIPAIQSYALYAADGRLSYSSQSEQAQSGIPQALLGKLQQSPSRILVEDRPGVVSLYEPLLADRDVVRFHPDWQAGQCYGYLRVSIFQADVMKLASQQEHVTATVTARLHAIAHQLMVSIFVTVAVFELAGLSIAGLALRRLERPQAGMDASTVGANRVQFYAYSDNKAPVIKTKTKP